MIIFLTLSNLFPNFNHNTFQNLNYIDMDTIVRFEFDSTSFFPKNYNGPWGIKLTNPPVIPATGDSVDIRIEEFFDDPELIRNYQDGADNRVFYAERLNTIIGKEQIEVIVVLYTEPIFRELFPRFFAGELAG